jgi:hypothetical protein
MEPAAKMTTKYQSNANPAARIGFVIHQRCNAPKAFPTTELEGVGMPSSPEGCGWHKVSPYSSAILIYRRVLYA